MSRFISLGNIKTISSKFVLAGMAVSLFLISLLSLFQSVASATPTFHTYGVPTISADPYQITSGPDGNLWFTENNSVKIGRITTSGSITEYTLPSSGGGYYHQYPQDITTGPDGNLWFTQYNTIGNITPSGSITEYDTDYGGVPEFLTSGPDGNLWYTAKSIDGDVVGKITTSGATTYYSTGSLDGALANSNIVTGSDGNLWYTSDGTGDLYVSRITTSGTVTNFSPPDGTVGLGGITAGPDGDIWFIGNGSDGLYIARMTTSGTVTNEYSLNSNWFLFSKMTTGSDGAIWATANGHLERITTSGDISEYSIPSGNGSDGITSGPEGNIWFTEYGADEIGQLVLPPNGSITLSATSPTSDPPSLSWNSITGADSYNIYRNTTDIGSSTTNSFTDSSAPQGTNSYYVTAVNDGGEGNQSNTINVSYDSTLPTISFFTANNGTDFTRQNTPYSSGVATQTVNSDGSVTVSVNSAPSYADSGFYLYNGTLGDLPNFTVNSSSGDFGLNLWFDNENLGDFFQWNGSGVMTGLGGDTYGLSSGSTGGTLSIDGSSSFFMMDDGQSYTLSQLIAGDDTTSGINSSTPVSVWIGVDVGSGGSTSATISSISGL